MRVELIQEHAHWARCLKEVGNYDFCHTFDFHLLSSQNGEGTPVGFSVVSDTGRCVAFWPALSRPVPGTDLRDLTSVYGYAGPVIRADGDARGSIKNVYGMMREAGYVTVFARMHPLLNNDLQYIEAGSERLGEIVVIPVVPGEDALIRYRGSHRREIAKARQSGVVVSISRQQEDILDFASLYTQAMGDLGAKEYYHFDLAYFRRLIACSDFDLFIAFAEYEGRRISAALFTVANGIMQYYLSGTTVEGRKFAPSKVIIAHVHALASELGVSRIVLGGGVGSSNDSLFAFKAGFSDERAPFYVTKRVLRPDIYQDLCGVAAEPRAVGGYFPRYRG